MTCSDQCRKPIGKQAHCGACHLTFSVVSHFDKHRKRGVCVTPESLGLTSGRNGVWALYGVTGGRNWWNNDKDEAP